MAKPRTRPTPHLRSVDLSDFKGVVVLGEPLEVLASALLRLRIKDVGEGRFEMDFTLPMREGQALRRALGRSQGDEDGARFLFVVERVGEACQAVRHGLQRAQARAMFEQGGLQP
jgi:hypothetical protein